MAQRSAGSMPQAASPAQRLTAAPATHWRDCVLLVAGGAVCWGGFIIVHQPLLAWLSAAMAVAAAITRVVVGGRNVRRRQIRDMLVEALAPLTGSRTLDRRTVQLAAWSGPWPGVPQRIWIRYAPGSPDGEIGWTSTLLDILRRRLQSGYKVQEHDLRRCRMLLVIDKAASSPAAGRVERTVRELIGPTSRIQEIELGGDGEPVRVKVAHQASTRLAASGYRARVERTFSTVNPGRWRANWDLVDDTVTFEIRPTFPQSIWLPPAAVDQSAESRSLSESERQTRLLASYREVAIPYGVDEDRNVMKWRPAFDPHLMVVGATGSGKTVLEHTVLAGVSGHGWPIWVVDGKGVEFLGFRDWPNVQIVATSIEDQISVIHQAWKLMDYRYRLVNAGLVTEKAFSPLMLFIDEYAEFRARAIAWYATVKVKGGSREPEVLEKLASIARLGRTGRVHLLFATQRPDATYFGGDFRDNFRARISVGRLSPQGAMMMWQDANIGTTVPRLCPGRATTINDQNRPVEIQTYRVPDPRRVDPEECDQIAVLERLRPAEAAHERLLIIPPKPSHTDSEGAPPTLVYGDVVEAEWAKAVDHPDLDPANVVPLSAEQARTVSSPMAMMKLNGDPNLPVDIASMSSPIFDLAAGDGSEAAEEMYGDVDLLEGYGPSIDADPEKLTIGDLLEVDGQWVTVDLEPEPDPADPDYISIGWRDDADNQGVVGLPYGERISARRPIEVQLEG